MVYTDSITNGTVKVYDAWNLRLSATFEAHQAPILKMAMNYEGSKLVTASCKGTVIRVFSLPKGQKLYSFKRGLANAMIYSLNFSRAGNYVVLSSEKGTIHCFSIPQKGEGVQEDNSLMEEDAGDISDLSIANDEDKECRVFSIASWLQLCFPVDYTEMMATKKSDYSLTNEDLASPNICVMDRDETKVLMFLKKGEFKFFTIEEGKLFQDLDFDAEF